MNNFCKYCGTPINKKYDLCPNCDMDKIAELEKANSSTDTPSDPVSKEPDFSAPTPQSPKAPQPAQGEKSKKKPDTKSLVTTLVCILLSVVLLLSSSASFLIFQIRYDLTESGLKKIIKQMDFVPILDEVTFNDTFKEFTLYDVFRELPTGFIGKDASDEEIEAFFDEDSVCEDLAEIVSKYTSFLFEDEGEYTLTQKEVTDFVVENRMYLKEHLGAGYSDTELKLLVKVLYPNDMDIPVDDIKTDAPVICSLLSFALSYGLMASLIVISLAIIGVMIFMKPYKGLIFSGVSLVSISLISAIIYFVSAMFDSLWLNLCSGSDLVAGVTTATLRVNFGFSAIPMVISIFMIIGGIALFVFAGKKKSTE